MNKSVLRKKRKLRIRKKLHGTMEKPRLVVYRSNKHIYAQLLNDDQNKTVGGTSDAKSKTIKNKSESAKAVGLEIAKIAVKHNIKKVAFDRSGYKYHGRVKQLADGAREGGLTF